jgi:2',3'-cyclic-nucleotide 2'-phosphodiesterase (5'-nucleotidase family)
VVIVIAHAGAACQPNGECAGELLDVVSRLREKVDAVVGGHTHRAAELSLAGVPMVVPGWEGSMLGVIELRPGGGDLSNPLRRLKAVGQDSVASVAKVIGDIVTRANERVAAVAARHVATMARRPSPGETGSLVADAMRVVGRADIAILDGSRVHAALDSGAVDYGDAYATIRSPQPLRRVAVLGGNLRGYLERLLATGTSLFVSGAEIVASGGGTAVDSILIQGQPLDDATVYLAVVPWTLLREFGLPSMGQLVLESAETGINEIEALTAYLRSLPQLVEPPSGSRIRVASRSTIPPTPASVTQEGIRVFVDGRARDVPRGSTAIDAVTAADAGEAAAIGRGTRQITDSRGLPVPADTELEAGSILRVIARRARD